MAANLVWKDEDSKDKRRRRTMKIENRIIIVIITVGLSYTKFRPHGYRPTNHRIAPKFLVNTQCESPGSLQY